MDKNLILKILFGFFFQEIQEDTAGSATAEEHEVISKDYFLVIKLSQDSPLLIRLRPSEHKVEMELELHSCASSDQVNFSSNFISEIQGTKTLDVKRSQIKVIRT